MVIKDGELSDRKRLGVRMETSLECPLFFMAWHRRGFRKLM